MDLFLLLKIIIALALGALIGIERERKGHEMEFAGVRTFMLIALLGVISAYLSQFYSFFLGLSFLGVVVLIA
ncbi:MAG: MgtC/SapB family protein, partial [Methanobacteriaceae archaeon]|nr:MgtC/SapB family protein [Methanobacteriaceae archaeon]